MSTILSMIGHTIAVCLILFGTSCRPKLAWCEHRVIPADRVAEAGTFMSNFLLTCDFYHTNGDDIAAVEGVTLRLYGVCAVGCMQESYFSQASRELALEAAIDVIANER